MLKERGGIVFYEKPKRTTSDIIGEAAAIAVSAILIVALAWTALAIRAGAFIN